MRMSVNAQVQGVSKGNGASICKLNLVSLKKQKWASEIHY